MITVLAFLTFLFEKGIGFLQINKARSALSVLYPDVEIGKHSLICRFIHGVRNLRIPTPKYPALWNAEDLLNYLAGWKVNSSSSLKDISLKLVTVLICVSVQRVHTLSLIDYRCIKFETNATYIYIFEDLKVQRQRPCFIITLPPTQEDDRLQSTSLLLLYLEKTQQFRISSTESNNNTKLFLSWRPPHQSVKTDTLARWIRCVLQSAGINVTVFGAHSVRGATSSFALRNNAPLESILRAGDWSRLSTFNKHYCRRNSFIPSQDVAKAISFKNFHDFT